MPVLGVVGCLLVLIFSLNSNSATAQSRSVAKLLIKVSLQDKESDERELTRRRWEGGKNL